MKVARVGVRRADSLTRALVFAHLGFVWLYRARSLRGGAGRNAAREPFCRSFFCSWWRLAKARWPSLWRESKNCSCWRRFQITLIALLTPKWVACGSPLTGMSKIISRQRSSSFKSFSESKSHGSGNCSTGLNFTLRGAPFSKLRCLGHCFRWKSIVAQSGL